MLEMQAFFNKMDEMNQRREEREERRELESSRRHRELISQVNGNLLRRLLGEEEITIDE